jgi:L-lactate dehydrogenase (cytochrome)
LTSFLDEHPAGPKVILKQAGKDGTAAFEPYHSRDIISTLGKESLCVGLFNKTSDEQVKEKQVQETKRAVASDLKVPAPRDVPPRERGNAPITKPPLGTMLNVFDFEAVAKTQMTKEGWDYYSSG